MIYRIHTNNENSKFDPQGLPKKPLKIATLQSFYTNKPGYHGVEMEICIEYQVPAVWCLHIKTLMRITNQSFM